MIKRKELIRKLAGWGEFILLTAFGMFFLFFLMNIIFPVREKIPYSQQILAADNTLMYAFLSDDEKWRMLVRSEEINQQLRKAILYKEDRFFYYHFGVNPIAIIRAAFNNIVYQKRTSGASTITMQVARLLYPQERTYLNKFTEMFRSFQLEWKYSKEEILNMYFNLVPYGGNIEGIKAASLIYFGRNPDKMSLAQIVSLAIIPNRPGTLRPGANTGELVKFIQDKKQKGIFLTVFGFGGENLKDSRLEKLADDGDGQYAYIDNFNEAKKVFVNELGATLFTIAKDSKVQVEFNPAKVKEYRLVGYENRALNDEDFEDDKKDGGEIGAGHTVTALYEITLQDDIEEINQSQLKYQVIAIKESAISTDEILTVKFRYKDPEGTESKLISQPVLFSTLKDKPGITFNFSAAVAMFGMILKDSDYKGEANLEYVLELSESNLGEDEFGYREEFVQLVENAKRLNHFAGR